MSEQIIPGITVTDELEHVVTGRYSTLSILNESDLVEVIEIANSRLAHTVVDGGDPLGRIAVFSRFITVQERELRRIQHLADPQSYETAHLKSL